ncbi:hypothetical protein KC867_01900, partial [Candidatus Saccharibacteria bacterium]|nr:hypothetical protein [Candidatus Saccharibacteria bacterium]
MRLLRLVGATCGRLSFVFSAPKKYIIQKHQSHSRAGKTTKKVTASARSLKKHPSRVYARTKRHTKEVHSRLLVTPHVNLMDASRWYAGWHSWQYKSIHHGHVHGLVLIAFTIGFGLLQMSALALDVSFTWDFANPSQYTYDDTKIESHDQNLRLALMDKIENFTQAGGQLQSNTILDITADDEYYYISNSLGLDVIRQDTWERTAYVTSGGGFLTLAVENGYLYAGKNGGVYRWQVSNMTENTPLGTYRYNTTTIPALQDNEVVRLNTQTINDKTYLVVVTNKKVHLVKDELGSPSIVGPPVLSGGEFIINADLTSVGDLYYLYRYANGLVQSGSGALFVTNNAIS